ncbi:MAG: creatininase family protein [Planctomycetes bacterium]|nr:creatininase family protein [Planctomycetota bacterium]
MGVHTLATMTWKEVEALDRARLVAVLPVGAVEAHGPHLPLLTDVIIAEGMAREGARLLSERGHEALLLPPLAYTSAGYGASFPGTVSIRPETATALLVDIARSLAAQGVKTLAIASAHLDPSHIVSIEAMASAIRSERLLAVAFPDITRKPWVTRLTDEFKSGACHAGRFEGSVVMAERPDLVREEIRKRLPPNPVSLSKAIREGKRTFGEAGGPEAYFGWPAEATAEEGRRTAAILGAILAEAVAGLTGR